MLCARGAGLREDAASIWQRNNVALDVYVKGGRLGVFGAYANDYYLADLMIKDVCANKARRAHGACVPTDAHVSAAQHTQQSAGERPVVWCAGGHC